MSPSRFGFAVCSQHSSRRSNYKQGSSCATLSGISTVKKIGPNLNEPTSQTQSQCSFAQPRSRANWALFSAFPSRNILNSFQVNFWSVLFAMKAEEDFFFPGWLHWIATEGVVSQLVGTCLIWSKVKSSSLQSILRWKKSQIILASRWLLAALSI